MGLGGPRKRAGQQSTWLRPVVGSPRTNPKALHGLGINKLHTPCLVLNVALSPMLLSEGAA